ncbi:MAG: methionine--tRNA ligase [Deltaproteobacteria bacterium]|nr:methionine--tRNA ligase [Deltaproteobacteria bacterium]
MSSFYITTAIDYVNGKPHLGHAYEKVGTDVLARWRRLMGDDVFYLTGTDEHGSKVEKTAAAAGMDPQSYVDSLVPAFEGAWTALNISHDRFIRTTDADHAATAIALLERIRDNGYLTEKKYEGWYCDGCEAFKTDKDLVEGKCPDHPTMDPRWIEETNLFFKLSEFGDRLLAHYDANPEFVTPAFRRNEVLSLIRAGLLDVSISRSRESVGWGIGIPFRPDSVLYVWFEALINYLTGAGYGQDDATFANRWPAVHVLGKDVTRFHCVLWPAMLMAADIELPSRIFAHGWVLTGGEKMSKSSGVGVEPVAMAERYGADPVRFYLVMEVPWGKDGEFTWERFETAYTAFLANGIGNLLSRSVSMAIKYFGHVPEGPVDRHLFDLCERVVSEATDAYDALRITEGAQAAWAIVRECNEQIQARAPWVMAKDPEQREALASFLYALLESLRIAAALLTPVMPSKCAELQDALGCAGDRDRTGADLLAWGGLQVGGELTKPSPLFPRLDQLLAD